MANTRVLIMDDERVFNDQLASLLDARGFDVEQCYDSEQGLLTVQKSHFELIILAVSLPILDGFFVLEKLRKVNDTPVIMVCNCNSAEQRLEGYQKGADDYLSKSFSFTEILLRINTLLRRTLVKTINQSQAVESHGLVLQKRGQLVAYAEHNIALTPIQFRLLWVLVESSKQILSKPYLYQMVLDRAFKPYDRTLDMHLSRIRKKLVGVGMNKECLKTVHGKGYLFS